MKRRVGLMACALAGIAMACSVGMASVPTTPPVLSTDDASAEASADAHRTPSPSPDGSSASDAGADAVVNGCTTFEDKTADAADRTIAWGRNVGTTCWRVKKGQSVTWNPIETFDAHPLAGDEATTPIAKQAQGSTPYTVVFSAAGTFGFTCGFHFDMTGAIQVVDVP